ncbi:MAG: hypothetical protein PHH26_03140 [Candidatus Thermoplasmatota archaeon]|nr:hypothetical protein [Candidatus Thermoplasmatota archaeon]
MNKIFGIGIAAMMLLVGLMSAMPVTNAANQMGRLRIEFIADYTNPVYAPQPGGETVTIEIGSLIITKDGGDVASVIAALPEGFGSRTLVLFRALEQQTGIGIDWEMQTEYDVSTLETGGPLIGHLSGGTYYIYYGNLQIASAIGYSFEPNIDANVEQQA